MNLPLIPQKDYRKSKNYPQNGSPNFVHERVSLVEEGINRVKNRGMLEGTGSHPPAHSGLQRSNRAASK
jgi:hypothetical protein